MMEITGETFPAEFLDRAEERTKYFDSAGTSAFSTYSPSSWCAYQGNLLKIHDLINQPIDQALAIYNTLPQSEIQPAAEFIHACVRLNPADRLTAEQLLGHTWLNNIGWMSSWLG